MEKDSKHKNIELRSDEVRDILSRPPQKLVRYGTTLLCLVLGVVFIGCFIFRYPDVVSGNVVVTTENPPVWLLAKSTGRIKDLYIADKQSVRQNELVAVIDNPAVTSDVELVKRLLTAETMISDSIVILPPDLLGRIYELGEIQPTYSSFAKAAVNYQNFITLNLTKQDEKALRMQIEGRHVYSSNLTSQLSLKREEMKLAQSTYNRDKQLFNKGVISKSELEASEQEYLGLQQVLQQLEATILTENIENTKLQSSASKLSVEYLQDKNNKYSDLVSAYRELVSDIENWEQKYLLIAPQAGVITFNAVWTKNQLVKTGDKVFVIVPDNQGDLVGKVEVAQSGIGKVKVGQLVHFKIAGYPYLEYGVLQGNVKNISLVANDDHYSVEVALSNGLVSTTGVQFNFTGELRGAAEIVTEDRSLASRILAPLHYLLTNHIR